MSSNSAHGHPAGAPKPRSMVTLWLIIIVSVAPVVAAYVLYFFVHPTGRPPYGALVDPQRPIPPTLQLRTLQGEPYDLRRLQGYWLMVMADPASCDAQCQRLLFVLRQVRIALGDGAAQVVRVWLVTDSGAVNPQAGAVEQGALVLRADPAQLASWLPVPPGGQLAGRVWLVDPFGHLMMQLPTNPDPTQTRKLMSRLLYNNAGIRFKHVEPMQ